VGFRICFATFLFCSVFFVLKTRGATTSVPPETDQQKKKAHKKSLETGSATGNVENTLGSTTATAATAPFLPSMMRVIAVYHRNRCVAPSGRREGVVYRLQSSDTENNKPQVAIPADNATSLLPAVPEGI
jgi:hypothetical protein